MSDQNQVQSEARRRQQIHRPASTGILALGALGMVFGDIGTSPLYALRTVFERTGAHDPVIIYGATSMAIWCVVLIVTVLYVRTLSRFNNDGEGGILALFALVRRQRPAAKTVGITSVLAIVGVSMFLADSMITPAISVLSAVEGLTIDFADVAAWVVPITVVILLLLFVVQRFGTARISQVFGPVMLIWFIAMATFGVHSIA